MIVLKTRAELEIMDRANALVHETLRLAAASAKPGVTTKELDAAAEEHIRSRGGVPAFKGYRGINDVIVHGIPSARQRLKEGDILSLDCGVVLEGFVGDAALTVAVGEITPAARKLLDTTKECLDLAVKTMEPGRRLTDLGATIQRHAEAGGFSVVRDLVGHGIGRAMHEDPQVHNFGPAGRGPELRPGLVLAIEPMVNAGKPGVVFDADGWTARTEDGKLSAHFEYSVAVTTDGPWVLGTGRR
jgi:methionyl aminopeptidase